MFEIDNTANLTDANRNGTQITRLINKRPNVKITMKSHEERNRWKIRNFKKKYQNRLQQVREHKLLRRSIYIMQ